jgi:hypothetical protein
MQFSCGHIVRCRFVWRMEELGVLVGRVLGLGLGKELVEWGRGSRSVLAGVGVGVGVGVSEFFALGRARKC